MRKIYLLFITLIIVLGIVCSCGSRENNEGEISGNGSDSAVDEESKNSDSGFGSTVESSAASGIDSMIDTGIKDPPMSSQPDEIIYPYDYKTYEELIDALSKDNAESLIQQEKTLWGEKFERFVDAIGESGALKLPKVYGELLPIRENDKLPKISVFKQEGYGAPWIWFHGEIDGRTVRVQMAYPTNVEIEEGMNASEILELIFPGAINVHNYGKNGYDDVYLTDISLKDRTVSAVIFDLKNKDNNYVTFYYDGYWVEVYTDIPLDDTAFWGTFELS